MILLYFCKCNKRKGRKFVALFGDTEKNCDEKASAKRLASKKKMTTVRCTPRQIIQSFEEYASTSFLPPVDPAVATQAALLHV